VTESDPSLHPARPEQRGRLHIASRAIERIVTRAAEQVDGVLRSGSGLDRLVGRSYPRVSSTVAGDIVRVTVDVAVLWPHGAGEVARRVRAEVTHEVRQLTGLSVAGVNVTVARFERRPSHAERRVQ